MGAKKPKNFKNSQSDQNDLVLILKVFPEHRDRSQRTFDNGSRSHFLVSETEGLEMAKSNLKSLISK